MNERPAVVTLDSDGDLIVICADSEWSSARIKLEPAAALTLADELTMAAEKALRPKIGAL